MNPQRPFLSASLRISGLVDILFLMALIGIWLGLLGHWHWLLDLFSHFRWQYGGICLLGIGWCLVMKRARWVLAICFASLLMNGTELYRTRGDPAFAKAEGGRLRVISLNVEVGNSNKKRVLDYLQSTRADVIFLVETNMAWAQALEPLKATHPHHHVHLQSDNFGVAVYSRVHLLEPQVLTTSETATPTLYARLIHEGREMVLLGVHPVPPIGSEWAASRDAQLQKLGEYVSALDLPVLLMGDLNATPWSHGMTLLQRPSGLDYRSPAASSLPTWQARNLFALPIDHALCTPPLVIPGRRIGPEVGSDHRPQELEVGWQP
ncbi:endonuclease/exonuclease/phosphatase family protein [Prosthecobacter sp. SYSU 5D2]